MKRSLVILLLSAFTVCAETFDELLRAVETHNPSIIAAQTRWQAARERIIVAGSLPDPRLSYSDYLEEIQTKTGPQQQKAGISQQFLMFGKRGLSEEAAAYDAEALYARARAVRAETLFQFKKNGFELFYLNCAIATARARKNLFQTLEKTAERAVENGGDARDLLDLRITLTQIRDHIQTLESKQTPWVETLNALLNRDPQSPIPSPVTLPPALFLTQQELGAVLRDSSPAIKEQRAMLAREQARETLAKRNGLPDITLGVDWIQTGDGGDDPLLANISLNLPLWHSKNRAERLRAEFERTAQAFHLENLINRVQVLLTEQRAERNDAVRREALYTAELIPPAEQHVELTRTAYENGAADLRELTASEERLLNLRLMLERSRVDRAVAEAGIEKFLGGPIE